MRTRVFPILFFLSVSLATAQISDEIARKIDTVFGNVDNHTPGYIIGVFQNDSLLWKKGYGLANLEHLIPIDSHTNFNIASLSKQITAAAIALLVLEDKISLEDPVSDYLEDFPFAKDQTKIKHLIYMTSGINDYYYNPRTNGTDWSSLQFFGIDDAIAASYGSGELMYQPGTQWSYSNINYMLLTKIVAKVSGMPFSEFVQQRIFKPLGMNNSLVNDDIFEVIPNRALGYNIRTEAETNWLIESNYMEERGDGFLQIHRNSPHHGGSGVYTTLEDFGRWLANFYNKSLGGEAFYTLMHRTEKFEHDKANDALGLVLDNYQGQDVVWYEGGDWGFSSFMLRFVASNTSIVCFSNLGTGNAKSKVWGVYDILVDHGILK